MSYNQKHPYIKACWHIIKFKIKHTKLFRKWLKKECPHICHICEFRDTMCDREWWKY